MRRKSWSKKENLYFLMRFLLCFAFLLFLLCSNFRGPASTSLFHFSFLSVVLFDSLQGRFCLEANASGHRVKGHPHEWFFGPIQNLWTFLVIKLENECHLTNVLQGPGETLKKTLSVNLWVDSNVWWDFLFPNRLKISPCL